VTLSSFERLARRVMASLPPRFQLDNVEIVVQEVPTAEHLAEAGFGPDEGLLGLYVGTPLTQRGSAYQMTTPDIIYLFRRPIEAECSDHRDLWREVKRTLWHEVAHYYGISDAELKAWGRG